MQSPECLLTCDRIIAAPISDDPGSENGPARQVLDIHVCDSAILVIWMGLLISNTSSLSHRFDPTALTIRTIHGFAFYLHVSKHQAA